eukprot:gnl/TRDRNA2_/TRDRNA2_35074_c0_seq1.p1 gnl/TRDRNA2_/TRDRNA2_35074_c0~~gnl/TRDRNA2_/TRDRNA2_35074_c0_seq1.p1  ORF type:complete len:279 (+),score=79.17 gnl/TRDRNA2_/TRDRNA2_35074_c0_seq1:43-837(+)
MGQAAVTTCTDSRACSACSGSDPISDTVKVSLSALFDPQHAATVDTEDVETHGAARTPRGCVTSARHPAPLSAAAAQAAKQADAELAEREAALERQLAEARRKDEERLQQWRAEEEAARQEREAQEAAARQLRMDVQLEAQQAAATQQQRLAEEEAQRHQKEAAARNAVEHFLKANGFEDVSVKRRQMLNTAYALHAAVKENNAEMIGLLLWAGADPSKKNSAGQTPRDMAEKKNKHGSHEAVLKALDSPLACNTPRVYRAGGA